jgi:hypothetical protein
MTLVITMATKNEIIMGADSQISNWDPNRKKFVAPLSLNATKIIEVKKHHMAASFWGQLSHIDTNDGSRPIRKHLINDIFPAFLTTLQNDDDVDSASEKFRDHLNSTVDLAKLEFPFGIHMGGYVQKNGRKAPKIRHVCLSPNDDKDHKQKDGTKFKSNDESQFSGDPPYAMVFNGFYYVVNALVNWVRQNYGDIYSLFNPRTMSAKQAINFTKYLINITKGFENYARSQSVVGGTVKILSINEKGAFSWHTQRARG